MPIRAGSAGDLYRNLAEQATDGIFAIDDEGRWVDVNLALCKMLGYSREEIIAKSITEVVHPDEAARLASQIRRVQKGTSAHSEWRFRRQDGALFYGGVNLTKLSGGETFGILRDITGRKQAEEALRESEEGFRGAFEYAAIGMAIVAPDGRWLRVNKSLCEIVGYSEEELLARDFQSITHPDDLETDLSLVGQMLDGSIPYYHMEKRYVHKDGQIVWILLSVSLVRDAHGEPLYFISQIQDITERKRAEESLRVSEQQLSLVYNNTTDTMSLMGVEKNGQIRLLSVNRRYIEASRNGGFKITEEDLKGRTVEEVMNSIFHLDAADVASTLQRCEEVIRTAKTMEYEEVHQSSSGMYYGRATLSPIPGPNGPCTWILYRSQNVTKSRLAEAALRESEKRLSALAEAAFEGLAFSESGILLEVNNQLTKMLGYSREEMIGKPILNLVAPESRQIVMDALQSSNPSPYTHLALRKDGSVFPVEICVRTVEVGGRQKRVSAVRDITERQRAEEALRQSEERFAKAFRSNPDGIIIATKDEGYILEANDAFLQMMGYSRSELIGKTSLELGIWKTPEERAAVITQLEETGAIRDYETSFRTKNGDMTQIQLSMEQVHMQGEACVLVTMRNVSERRQMEQQLRSAQKMEAIGRLAGGVAHDFNNILMIIRSAAEMTVTSRDPRIIARYLGQIQSATDKAAAVTNQLLAFSRQQVLQPEVLDLNAVVSDFWNILPRLLGADVRSELRLGQNLGFVSADRSQLEQVILNLAVNARDAMPDGGTLILETASARLDAGGPAFVVMSMTDDGVGMDAETQARIFEPFFTTKKVGTGLGLATVYGIVRQSGGHLLVHSQPGKGTTFEIHLPRVDGTVELKSLPDTTTPVRGAETLLLVEDEQDLRGLASDFLRSKGYQVLEAGSVSEALQICRNHGGPIHLLLTDIVMPGGRGPELARAIQKMRPDVLVIYMSGYADTATATGFLGSNAPFLQKPFSLTVLARTVCTVLDGRSRT